MISERGEGLQKTEIPKWLWVAVAATLLLSLVSVASRHAVEASNKTVALAAEYEAIEALAAAERTSLPAALSDLRAQGLNALVVGEETIGDLIDEGRATIVGVPAPTGVATGLRFADPAAIPRVVRGLRIRFGEAAGPLEPLGDSLALPNYSAALLRQTSIGLDPDQTRAAREAGLIVVARFGNPAASSPEAIGPTLAWAASEGARVFLPQGDQVLGRRDALEATREGLRAAGMLYASPEFAKIGGDPEMVASEPANVVRLHTAQPAELDKLSVAGAIDRFANAARERNIRMLLLRPVSLSGPQPLQAFGDFVGAVGQQVMREGGDLGMPRGFRDPALPALFFVVLGLAAAPIVWFAGAVFVGDRQVRFVGAALAVLLAFACWVSLGRQGMALMAAIAFPFVAFVALDAFRPRNVLLGFVLVSAITLVGGLFVAGMLNGLPYFVKAREFLGIRVAVSVPILLVGAYFWMRLTDWRATLRNPITWGTALLGVGIAAALGIMVARSGNDGGVGASGAELALRGLLDRILYVRPRTKEFLIGHPLMVVAVGLLGRLGEREKAAAGWTVLLLMLGAIGQTSVVNTLAHLHIPVALSLARVAEGLVIGGALGLLLWAIAQAASRRGE